VHTAPVEPLVELLLLVVVELLVVDVPLVELVVLDDVVDEAVLDVLEVPVVELVVAEVVVLDVEALVTPVVDEDVPELDDDPWVVPPPVSAPVALPLLLDDVPVPLVEVVSAVVAPQPAASNRIPSHVVLISRAYSKTSSARTLLGTRRRV